MIKNQNISRNNNRIKPISMRFSECSKLFKCIHYTSAAHMRTTNAKIGLHIRAVWSETSLSADIFYSSKRFCKRTVLEGSNQIGPLCRLILIFVVRTYVTTHIRTVTTQFVITPQFVRYFSNLYYSKILMYMLQLTRGQTWTVYCVQFCPLISCNEDTTIYTSEFLR